MRYRKYFFISMFIFSSLFFTACQEFNRRNSRPVAQGKTCEIVVVMNETQWKGELGEALKEVFMEYLPAVLRDESRFSLRFVKPQDFKGYLKQHKNIIIISTFDDESTAGKNIRKQYISTSAKEKIAQNPNAFLITKEDTYAEGQFIMTLFGKDEQELIRNLYNSKTNLQNYFYAIERQRLQDRLYGVNEQKKLAKTILAKHGLVVRIPAQFVITKDDENFMWFRKRSDQVDWHLYFAVLPYTSEKMFEEEYLLNLRDSLGRRQLNDRSLDKSYMMTETYIPPILTKMKLNDNFAVEYRGLWRLKNATRGGVFVAYAFADAQNQKFYYVEGFLYAPSKDDKRTYVLELEAMLQTFQIQKQEKQTQ